MLKELLADDGALWPKARVVFLSPLVFIPLNQLFEADEVGTCGSQEYHDLVVVVGEGDGIKGNNSSLVGYSMLRKHFLLNHKVDWISYLLVEQQ